ncbi:23S rRNA (adenine(2030)-N(6))-methyltransferase RlmJ [Caulobacter sp. 17J80-11]|uniref:23S rRNA (adenine(2030)-N(6))-methyltransferase RlmJ n=1 Tax=Caulobacter sp. 17J80-11 TaxID=2763502 RepID=UPI001653714F|nr:23S rRNA (adenine(2030)-N(6))-methyltransferase RlmJ [Caulobacter sp. 17J80-11]
MNYRHAFHAGNFADLVKHAALTRVLATLMAEPSPLTVVDTHAGAGLYDLTDPAQVRSREAEQGVARLMAAQTPPVFDALVAAVKARNPKGGVKVYPGSPALILDALRPQDRYVACELREDVHADLAEVVAAARKPAEARAADGYEQAAKVARQTRGRMFLLIDPPFERADDYVRVVEAVHDVLRARPEAVVAIWLPLKDLETFDAFVRRLEAIEPPKTLLAEVRLRPLVDPMKMNGCVMAVVNPPAGAAADLQAIGDFVVEALGERGGKAKLWSVGG